MTDEQRRVHDNIVGGKRGELVGPLRAALLNPALAEQWQQFGAALRFGTSVPRTITEVAILVTGRRWNSQVEYFIHARDALAAGVPAALIEQIRLGQVPEFDTQEACDAYEYARQLQAHGNVEQVLYDRMVARWQPIGVMELTAVIGYYTMVSMTLNAHDISVPEGQTPPLSVEVQQGLPVLAELPPGVVKGGQS